MRIVLIWISAAVFLLYTSPVRAGGMKPEAYIARYKDIAVAQMKQFGIPASITLAQGGLESGWGGSELAVNANNHFGIKCHSWNGPVYHKDAETPNECFRRYSSPEESYRDHSKFLRYRERYAFLFTLESTDYTGWANGLLSAGYSTNPAYAERLIGLIEKYGLYRYDIPAGSVPAGTARTEKAPGLSANEGIGFVIANGDETYADIAKEYNIYLSDLIRYNDARTKSGKPGAGTRVYLGRKKAKAQKRNGTHTAVEGDTYYSISQQYGIRLKCIYRYNGVGDGDTPAPGDTVYLRKKKKK